MPLRGARRGRGAGLTIALVLASTACSGSDDREASGPTPDEALAELELAAGELLGAGAPGNEITVLPRREVPCGGPGGNERIKVKYSYVAGAGLVDDPEQTLGAATAAGEALGLETELREVSSTELGFRGESFRGALRVLPSGALQVRAQTDCLDHPQR